ncbi:MAG TPA: GLPGLI family protein [Daejeonella sp.]|nr:GLPGLI family protein [Daejeonella sp.]
MSKQFLVFICFCCLFSNYVFSQQKASGVIYYTQTTDLRAMAQGNPQAQRFAGANLPDKITNKFELLYSPKGAKLQRASAEEDISQQGGGGEGQRIMRFAGGSEREVFYSPGDSKVTESLEMNGEQLLIENKLGSGSTDFVKSDETKKIAGFDCKKVTIKDKSGQENIIWYTTDLPFVASPMPAFWTEGVVLGIENKRIQYFASSIEYTKVKDSELALPKKGKLITQEEFQAKQDEMRKRMQEQFRSRGSGDGNQVIIRQ